MAFSPSTESHAEHRLLSARVPHLLQIGVLARQLQCEDPWLPEPLLLALQKLHRSCTMQKRAGSGGHWTNSGTLDLARTLLQPASARHDDIKQQVAKLEREISAVRAAFASLDGAIAQARVELEREAACLMTQLRAPELRSTAWVEESDKGASLITIAAQSRILAKAIAAISKARVEFVSELEHVVTLANMPWQQTSGRVSLVAFFRMRGSSEPIQIQAIAARVRQLVRASVLHATRESAFRESCVRVQTAVENHISELSPASENPGFLRSADS